MVGGGTIRVRIIEAKDIAFNQKHGLPDPYCKVSVDKGKHKKTKTKKKSISPVWEETFSFDVEHKDHVLTFHVKNGRLRSTILGLAETKLEDMKQGENDLWLDLKEPPDRNSITHPTTLVGKLHISIYWLPTTSESKGSDGEPSSPKKLERNRKSRDHIGRMSFDEDEPLEVEDRKLGLIYVHNFHEGLSQRVITTKAEYQKEYEITFTEGSVVTVQVGQGNVVLGFDNLTGKYGKSWFKVDDVRLPAQLLVQWQINISPHEEWLRVVELLDSGVGGMIISVLFLGILSVVSGLGDYYKGILHAITTLVFIKALAVAIHTRNKRHLAAQQVLAAQQQGGVEASQVLMPALLKTEKTVRLRILEIKEINSHEASHDDSALHSASGSTLPHLNLRQYEKPLRQEEWGGWGEADPYPITLRGPNYLQDRKKIPAGNYHFELAHIETFHHYQESKISNAANRHDSWVSQQKPKEEWCFVVNWQVPGTPKYNLVCYFTLAKKEQEEPKDSQNSVLFNRLLERFLEYSKENRDTRFKMIPRVVEGTWVVQKGVGTTPAILGTKMTQTYFDNKEKNYFEVDVDVGSSKVGGQIFRLVKGYAKSVVIDFHFLIEGQQPDELPEQLLGGVRLHRLDTDRIPLLQTAPIESPSKSPKTNPPHQNYGDQTQR